MRSVIIYIGQSIPPRRARSTGRPCHWREHRRTWRAPPALTTDKRRKLNYSVYYLCSRPSFNFWDLEQNNRLGSKNFHIKNRCSLWMDQHLYCHCFQSGFVSPFWKSVTGWSHSHPLNCHAAPCTTTHTHAFHSYTKFPTKERKKAGKGDAVSSFAFCFLA